MAAHSQTGDLAASANPLPWQGQEKPAAWRGDSFTISRLVVRESLQAQALAVRAGTVNSGDDPQTSRQMLDTDGYFGERQTRQRIVKFALEIAGPSAEGLLEIQKGIRAGFAEIAEEWGTLLPVICIQTALAVTEQLDAWAENLGEAQQALVSASL